MKTPKAVWELLMGKVNPGAYFVKKPVWHTWKYSSPGNGRKIRGLLWKSLGAYTGQRMIQEKENGIIEEHAWNSSVYICVCAYVFSIGNRLLTGMLTNPNKIKYNKSWRTFKLFKFFNTWASSRKVNIFTELRACYLQQKRKGKKSI